MNGKVKVSREITLFLNKDEAEWLRAFVQNPLSDPEVAEEKQARSDLYHLLGKLLGED